MAVQFRLRGWGALAVLLAFASVWGYRQWSMRTTIDGAALDKIKPWIVAEFASKALSETAGRPFEQLTTEERRSLSEKVLAAGRAEVKVTGLHGLGDEAVVRVEVSIDGQPPPDGRTTRYYRLNHSLLLGWTFRQEVPRLSYWLELF